jgi:glycosyltransferase involved in cell wall biosynthesis
MIISYAICVKNEGKTFGKLLGHLEKNIRTSDEIVIIDDFSGDLDTMEILKDWNRGTYATHDLNNDFAAHKNFMNSQCKGDFIVNLDADEWVSEDFIEMIPALIEENPNVEAYWVPRLNTVEGLTDEHVRKWNWKLTDIELGDTIVKAIQWPDYQMRIYKNDSRIKWKNKVHELLEGYETYATLPAFVTLAIEHHKNIERQTRQNNFYATLQQ